MTNIDRAADIIQKMAHPPTPSDPAVGSEIAQALADATPTLLMPDPGDSTHGLTVERTAAGNIKVTEPPHSDSIMVFPPDVAVSLGARLIAAANHAEEEA